MASLILRGPTFYIQYMVSGKAKRVSTGTESLQIAKEKLRQFESAQASGGDRPLPTRAPIDAVLTAYVSHIRNVKTAKSPQTDIYYLRDAFGPICEALRITSRKVSAKTKKRPPKPGQDRRRKAAIIEANCFEQITTADIAGFISGQVKSRGLAPKTANRCREILKRLFNWAMTQNGVRRPREKNPAAPVERYQERAPDISFLTLTEIDEQLDALADDLKMQAMADGVRPHRLGSKNSWTVHHIYSGKFPHPEKQRTVHAAHDGSHCTPSAGLVAVDPIADEACDEYPAFAWLLRAMAFQKFGYDPDEVFSSNSHDPYGFSGQTCFVVPSIPPHSLALKSPAV